MEDKNLTRESSKKDIANLTPNFTKPVWTSQEVSCQDCAYNEQDIDTFPCAKCHIRQ